MIAGQGFVTPRFYASLGSIPLAIRASSGRRRICWDIRRASSSDKRVEKLRRLVLEPGVGEGAASGVPDLEGLALFLELPRLGKGSGDLGDQASSAGSTGSSFHSATASLLVAAQILAAQCRSQLMNQLPPYLWSRG